MLQFCDSFHKKFEKNLINSHLFVKPPLGPCHLNLKSAHLIFGCFELSIEG